MCPTMPRQVSLLGSCMERKCPLKRMYGEPRQRTGTMAGKKGWEDLVKERKNGLQSIWDGGTMPTMPNSSRALDVSIDVQRSCRCVNWLCHRVCWTSTCLQIRNPRRLCICFQRLGLPMLAGRSWHSLFHCLARRTTAYVAVSGCWEGRDTGNCLLSAPLPQGPSHSLFPEHT